MSLPSRMRVVLLPRITARRHVLPRGRWSLATLESFLRVAEPAGLGLRSVEESVRDGDGGVALVLDRYDEPMLRHAAPMLFERSVGFTVVVESARVGQLRRRGLREREAVPPWSELRALLRAGADVASGGHHGVSLRALEPEVVYGELLRSRCEIERRLGRAPRAVRYPFGEVDEVVASVARSAGFELGLTTRSEVGADPLRIRVLRPGLFESPERFVHRIRSEGEGPPRRAAAGG